MSENVAREEGSNILRDGIQDAGWNNNQEFKPSEPEHINFMSGSYLDEVFGENNIIPNTSGVPDLPVPEIEARFQALTLAAQANEEAALTVARADLYLQFILDNGPREAPKNGLGGL